MPITLKAIGLADMLDMFLVAALIYALLVWFKKTKTAFVAMGLLVTIGVYAVAWVLGMTMTIWIFQGFFAVLIIAIVIIFQEELRSIFERVAIWSLSGGGFKAVTSPKLVEILMRSISNISRDKIGAIIVIAGRDPLDRHIEGGIDLNGDISEALIESVFDPHSVGHDGALVIDDGRVAKFGCHLPLSKEYRKISRFGTRHSAALGLAERTDALCIVISEERGTISIARHGDLTIIRNPSDLEKLLEDFLKELAPPSKEAHDLKGELRAFWKRDSREKGIAFAMSVLLWLFFIGLRPS